MDFTADNTMILDDWGIDARLTTRQAVNIAVRVLFDREKRMVDLLGAGDLKSFDPTAQLLTADAEKYRVARGDELKIGQQKYKICETPEPDGAGLTTLQLKKA